MTRPPNAIAVWALILAVLAAVALFIVAVAEPVGHDEVWTPQTVGEPIPTPVEEP